MGTAIKRQRDPLPPKPPRPPRGGRFVDLIRELELGHTDCVSLTADESTSIQAIRTGFMTAARNIGLKVSTRHVDGTIYAALTVQKPPTRKRRKQMCL